MKMNNIKQLLIASIFVATPVFAGGNADAGKEKSAMCAGCHGADGNSEITANPKLAGQYQTYLLNALKDYKSGKRQDLVMGGMVASLTDQDLKDLAAFFSEQKSTLTVLP